MLQSGHTPIHRFLCSSEQRVWAQLFSVKYITVLLYYSAGLCYCVTDSLSSCVTAVYLLSPQPQHWPFSSACYSMIFADCDSVLLTYMYYKIKNSNSASGFDVLLPVQMCNGCSALKICFLIFIFMHIDGSLEKSRWVPTVTVRTKPPQTKERETNEFQWSLCVVRLNGCCPTQWKSREILKLLQKSEGGNR